MTNHCHLNLEIEPDWHRNATFSSEELLHCFRLRSIQSMRHVVSDIELYGRQRELSTLKSHYKRIFPLLKPAEVSAD